MKQRVLVMNGQRLVQEAHGDQWVTMKVEKAGVVKPGIYNVYSAVERETTKSYEGPLVHADASFVYQSVGKSLVKHPRVDFDAPPDIGTHAHVAYSNGKAILRAAGIKRGRSIS